MKFILNLHSSCFRLLKKNIYFQIFSYTFKTWDIVFFGSDNFSIVSLQKLIINRNKLIRNIEVVSTNNYNPLSKFSLSNNIKVHVWPPKFQKTFDFGVIVSFGKLIPKSIIELFSLGIINVHPSLLPKWRGAMPIFYAIKNGDFITGVTIQVINPQKFDIGEIIFQKSFTIGKNEMYLSLYNRLSKYSSECLLEVIQGMPHCLDKKVLQSNEGVSWAKKITKDISLVDWKNLTALEIYNLYRAVYGIDILKTYWKGILVNLFCLSINNSNMLTFNKQDLVQPGKLIYFSKQQCLVVKCKEGVLNICTVMVKGKLYNAKNFYLGFLSQDKKNMNFDEKK